MRYILTSIVGFLLLDLYFNLVPLLIHLNTFSWLVYAIVFFPFAHFVAKRTNLQGLKDLGVIIHFGWKRNLTIGFLIGAIFWLTMEWIFLSYTRSSIFGMKSFGVGTFFMVQAIVGMFLGSFINDIIVRGYVFAQLNRKVNNVSLILISTIIYALDDSWYVGFSLYNTIFSILLGLTLAYVFLKTGSLWACTGIHWGLNVIYCIFYGIPGRESEKGLLLIERHHIDSFFIDHLSIIISLIMFIFILLFYKNLKFRSYDAATL